jgi:glutathione S-transferase
MSGDKNEIKTAVQNKIPAIVKFLGEKQFLIGDYVTWMDFFFFELIDSIQWLTDGALFSEYPSLEAYFQRFITLPNLKGYWESEKCIKRPFNNKIAKLNN